MGRWVAKNAANDLQAAIERFGSARLVIATGASQFEVLSHLAQAEDVDWTRVHGFHLDEYVGLSPQHPASFCRYLRERFVDRVPLADFQYLHGDEDAAATIARAGRLISESRIDVALVGIGENGHLAFNDPPADFTTTEPYLLVELDHACRMQQVGEGWFASLADVPTQAISMSVNQILKAVKIYCSVPDERKAHAVAATIEGPITALVPATALRRHPASILIIDEAASVKLKPSTKAGLERIP